MTVCNCPVLPAFDELTAEELDQLTGSPLRCTSCGEELELRCPEGHVHHAPRTRSPNRRVAAAPATVRTCAAGHPLPFRKTRCLVCRPVEPRRGPHSFGNAAGRRYKQKPCMGGCAELFTPTGPRDDICTKCRRRTTTSPPRAHA